MSETDDKRPENKPLDNKLEQLESSRRKVKANIDASQAALDSIEEQIETVKRKSKERLLQDNRVDNKLVMGAQQDAQGGAANRKSQPFSSSMSHERVVLVPNSLTEDDITVHPTVDAKKKPPAQPDDGDSRADR